MESIDFNFNTGKLEKNDLIHTLGDADIDNFATQISLFFIAKNSDKFTIFSSNIASISSKID